MANFRLKPASRALLVEIGKATGEAPYKVKDRESAEVKELDKHLLVLYNDTGKTAAGTPAVLSAAGKAKLESYRTNEPATTRGPLPKADDFEIESGVDIPQGGRTVVRQVYPFDKLGVGQSFFIPPSESNANPARSKQSTVSSFNRKAAEDFEARKAAGEPTANAEGALPVKMRIAESEKDGVKGARVWRIQ